MSLHDVDSIIKDILISSWYQWQTESGRVLYQRAGRGGGGGDKSESKKDEAWQMLSPICVEP